MRKCYVDAIRFTGENADEVAAWVGGEYQGKFKHTNRYIFICGSVQVFPHVGDWIVRDPAGLLIARDPDFFEAVYAIDDPTAPIAN
jgi:hypothetical protein